ncbi:MAG: permease [Thermoplasmata archaeon]|nr:permease [Thermoplasmata archaeon]
MIEFVKNIVYNIAELWKDIAFYLLIGMFIAGIIHIYLGQKFITKHLGKGKLSIIKASIFGVPLPVCSCGVIPIASSLREDGASRSATLSFMVSTPTTGIDSIFATYSLLGPIFAIFRPIFALFAGIVVGLASYLFDREEGEAKHIHEEEEKKSFKNALKYAFEELPADIGKWLIIGIIAGGVIASIPYNFDFIYPYDFLVALLISLPLYVCATGSIPIAAALFQKGFSPGAVLIFLIAGPATNTITLTFVRYKLGGKSFYIYLATIASLSLFAGAIFNFIWSEFNLSAGHPYIIPDWLKIVSAIILAVIIARVYVRKEKKYPYKIYVPDMSCSHCKAKIGKELEKAKVAYSISLDKKIVSVEDVERALNTIEKAGHKGIRKWE